MSFSYWMIEGVGIRVDDIADSINVRRCVSFLREQLPEEEISEDGFNIKDYLYGEPFDNLGDLLCCCDDMDCMAYGDDGNEACYFYYPPKYPWDQRVDEPKTLKEVHEIIIEAVQKICDLTPDQIESLIDDDIYVFGCGS